MTQFFEAFVVDIARLIGSQLDFAKKRDIRPGHFVLCGGPARNSWLRTAIFAEARKLEPQLTMVAETKYVYRLSLIAIRQLTTFSFRVGTIDWGALSFPESPIEQDSFAKENVGIAYLDTLSASGNPLKGDKVKTGIAWLIEKVPL